MHFLSYQNTKDRKQWCKEWDFICIKITCKTQYHNNEVCTKGCFLFKCATKSKFVSRIKKRQNKRQGILKFAMNFAPTYFYGYLNIVLLKRYLYSVHYKHKVTAFSNLDKLHCFCKYDCFARHENAVPHLSCPVVSVVMWGSPFFKDCQQCAGAIKSYDLKSGFLIKNMFSLITLHFQGITATKTY